MYMCRVFRRDRPLEQVDARLVDQGCVTIGRDPAADWPLDDPRGTLSRVHCSLQVERGELLLCDSSTNGTFLEDGQRLPRNVAVPLEPGRAVRLGELLLRIESARDEALTGNGTATVVHLPAALAAPEPQDWEEPPVPEAAPTTSDGSLLEAFCEGARLDSSAFSGEDPEQFMRRLGEVYHQTVLGLAALMQARTRLKGEYQLDRTTISAAENNPLRWTPNRRLAENLLTEGIDGFMAGPQAVRASFEDVARHLAATAAGANAAVTAVIETLSPDAIEAEAATQGFSLRGKSATAWEAFRRRHADLVTPEDPSAGLAAAAFKAGYAAADGGSAEGAETESN